MLVMITNRCNEGCRHCLSDCKPEGTDMSFETLKKVIEFRNFVGSKILILSGGELTIHPKWFEICDMLNEKHISFGLCTNGTWIECPETVTKMGIVKRMMFCAGIQVYTNKLYYKSYDFVKSHEKDFQRIGLKIDKNPIRSMKDLGRAKYDEECQKLIENDKYSMSCLNTHLSALQVKGHELFVQALEMNGYFCKPCIDPIGNIHMSESQLCPSMGNIVYESFDDIWSRISKSKPCGACKDFQKFMKSDSRQYLSAKKIFGYWTGN